MKDEDDSDESDDENSSMNPVCTEKGVKLKGLSSNEIKHLFILFYFF